MHQQPRLHVQAESRKEIEMLTIENVKRAVDRALTGGADRLQPLPADEAVRRLGMALVLEAQIPDERIKAYAAIDSERDYQDELWHDTLTVGEFVLLLEEYAWKARGQWTTEPKPEVRTMEVVRKVAALAVACMEQHGVVQGLPSHEGGQESHRGGIP